MEHVAVGTPVDRRSVVSLISRLRSPKGQSNPYPIYAELRKMGDVVPAPWGGYLLVSHDLCDQVLRSRSWLVPDAEWRARQGEAVRWEAPSSHEISRTLSGLNPPHHTRQRRSLGNVFDKNTLRSLDTPVKKTVDLLLDRLAEQLASGEADFASLVSEELPIHTIGHWLDLPPADYPLIRSLTHNQVYAGELLPSKSQLAISDTATLGLRKYFTELIRRRRNSPGDDPVSAWLRTWDALAPDQETADRTVYYLTLFIVMASLETTSTLLSTMVWLLDQHPLQREWLRAHPQHVPDAVEEILRYDPPIHVISKVAAEDTELAGVPVPKDGMVHVLVGAANHDPAQYADPDTFDIRRRGSHLSFGGGFHYCIGAALGRLEATTLLSSLLRRLPSLRVSGPPTWASRVVFRRLAALPVASQ